MLLLYLLLLIVSNSLLSHQVCAKNALLTLVNTTTINRTLFGHLATTQKAKNRTKN